MKNKFIKINAKNQKKSSTIFLCQEGYRVSLVSVSESGSNSLRIFNTKSNIFQKIEIGKLFFHRFQNIAHLLVRKKCCHFCSFNLVNFRIILSTKTIISHEMKKGKNRKFILLQVSEYCAYFCNKNPIWPLLRGGRGRPR